MANQAPPPGVYRERNSSLKQNLIWVAVAILGIAGGAIFIARLPPPEAPLKKNEEGLVIGKPSTLVITTGTTGVPGAQVFIDQKPSGATDAKGQLKIELPSNAYYFVEVKKEGYPDMTSNVRLGANEEREVAFEMEEAKASADAVKKKK
ncbi:MAG: PEGA domain-containing protein [Acidobacteria bacterium]|nr:PEGA domain-containing protein [Acidobacteriota bacterium]